VAGPCKHGNEPSGSMKAGNLTSRVTVSSQGLSSTSLLVSCLFCLKGHSGWLVILFVRRTQLM
jgi:hypothetical protein